MHLAWVHVVLQSTNKLHGSRAASRLRRHLLTFDTQKSQAVPRNLFHIVKLRVRSD